jgi:hypothetical protein
LRKETPGFRNAVFFLLIPDDVRKPLVPSVISSELFIIDIHMPGGLTWYELPTLHCLFVSRFKWLILRQTTVLVVKCMWFGVVNILEDKRNIN